MKYPNVEAERARQGITKEELAKRLGVDRKTLINWQSGKTQMPICKLVQLTQMFGCSADYILGMSGNPFPDGKAS